VFRCVLVRVVLWQCMQVSEEWVAASLAHNTLLPEIDFGVKLPSAPLTGRCFQFEVS
jgi:hypothetical protein